jgi:hypothetical protein
MTTLHNQREIVRKQRNELELQEKKLLDLYNNESEKLCPFRSGDEIEYEPGKKGKVEKFISLTKHGARWKNRNQIYGR